MCMFPACCFHQIIYISQGLVNGVLNETWLIHVCSLKGFQLVMGLHGGHSPLFLWVFFTDKNLRKTHLKELKTNLNQRGYPTTVINKGFEKVQQWELRNPKKHNKGKSLAYVATYNKNNPELFTEIIKNLEELENNDKIKEILDITKIKPETTQKS